MTDQPAPPPEPTVGNDGYAWSDRPVISEAEAVGSLRAALAIGLPLALLMWLAVGVGVVAVMVR